MKIFSDFVIGFTYVITSFRFLFKNISLLRLAIFPFIINVILFVVFAYLLYTQFGTVLSLIISKPEEWYWLLLYTIFSSFAFLFILIIGIFFLCLIGNILAAPFHEWMAEKTRALVRPDKKNTAPFSIKYIIITQIKKLSLLLMLQMIALLFLYLPVIGIFISGVITLFLLSFQFMDFPLGIEHQPLKNQITYFLKAPFAWLGLGAGISLFLAVPFLNLITLPCGVVAASLLYYKYLEK